MMRIGPASVYSPITGPVEIRVDDKVIKLLGSDRCAGLYAEAYNRGWWRKHDLEARAQEEARIRREDPA